MSMHLVAIARVTSLVPCHVVVVSVTHLKIGHPIDFMQLMTATDSPHKGPVMQEVFPCHDVMITY